MLYLHCHEFYLLVYSKKHWLMVLLMLEIFLAPIYKKQIFKTFI